MVFPKLNQPGLTGYFFNAKMNGQGIHYHYEKQNNQAVVYVYTYDSKGAPVWYVGQQAVEKASVEMTLWRFEGGLPLTDVSEASPSRVKVGSLKMWFQDLDTVVTQWTFGDEVSNKQVEMKRLTQRQSDAEMNCSLPQFSPADPMCVL